MDVLVEVELEVVQRVEENPVGRAVGCLGPVIVAELAEVAQRLSGRRVGVFELLTLNSELRRLVNARATEEEIVNAARANGLSTLREQAIELVRQGVTTIDEITRVFHEL